MGELYINSEETQYGRENIHRKDIKGKEREATLFRKTGRLREVSWL